MTYSGTLFDLQQRSIQNLETKSLHACCHRFEFEALGGIWAWIFTVMVWTQQSSDSLLWRFSITERTAWIAISLLSVAEKISSWCQLVQHCKYLPPFIFSREGCNLLFCESNCCENREGCNLCTYHHCCSKFSIILFLPLLFFLCILYPKNNDLLEYPLKLRFFPQ